MGYWQNAMAIYNRNAADGRVIRANGAFNEVCKLNDGEAHLLHVDEPFDAIYAAICTPLVEGPTHFWVNRDVAIDLRGSHDPYKDMVDYWIITITAERDPRNTLVLYRPKEVAPDVEFAGIVEVRWNGVQIENTSWIHRPLQAFQSKAGPNIREFLRLIGIS